MKARWLALLPLLVSSSTAGQCLLVPTVDGSASVGECLDEDAAIPYNIYVSVPAEEASQRFLGCQLLLELEGMLTKSSREPLTNAVGVVETSKSIFSKKLGKVLGGQIVVEGRACNHEWGCKTITINDGHRYWKLDCGGVVNKQGDAILLSLSGVKRYKVTVITDPVAESSSASNAFISMRLLGEDGSQSSDMSLVSASRTPGIAYSTYITAADVGATIKELNITNHTPNDPWKFKTITITTDDGTMAKFAGNQYIGTPYERSLLFRNEYFTPSEDSSESAGLDDVRASDPVPIYVECHTRLVDIITGVANQPFTMKVQCPTGCDVSPLSYVVGLTLHPAISSICSAAVADGSLSVSGGLVQLQLYPSDSRDVSSLYLNVSSIKLHPYRDDPTSSASASFFTTARISSLDDLDSYLRVVDIFGRLSHTGRLELQTKDGTWGSVCTNGDTEHFSAEAAKVACQEMGFLWGSIIDSTCDAMNLCAPRSMPIVAGGITCKGTEDTFSECAIQDPAPICADHTHDVLIHCSDTPPTLTPPAGTIRLIDSGGAPAIRGIGRLEIYLGHEWTTVCNDGWTRTATGVACREMGYTSVKDNEYMTTADQVKGSGNQQIYDVSDNQCENIMGSNYCGKASQRIGVTDVVCDGSETRLRDCSLNAPDDVYCVHAEDVVIGCDGPGDPSGIGLYAAEHVPHIRTLPLKPTKETRCTDTFTHLFSKEEPKPGELYIIRCPANCAKTQGVVVGTYVYTWDSTICHSAIHSGIIDDTGMAVGLLAGHGQYQFPPSVRHGITSEQGSTQSKSMTFVKMSADLSARMPVLASELSKIKNGGFSLLNGKFMIDRENYKRAFSMEELAGGLSNSQLSFLQTGAKPVNVPQPLVAFCNEGNTLAKFDGTPNGRVTLNNLPGGSSLTSLDSFSLIIRFRPAEMQQGWRSLLSFGECDGFNVVLDPSGEVIFEQQCTSLVIHSKIVSKPGHWTTVTVTYDSSRRLISIYDKTNEVIQDESVTEVFRWSTFVRVGSSSVLEYEPFIGDISHVMIYNYSLKPVSGSPSTTQISHSDAVSLAVNRLSDTCMRLSPSEPAPMYSNVDYRLCISDCTGARKASARKQMSRLEVASMPAIPIDCTSSLDNTSSLNSELNAEIEVICPLNCFSDHPLELTAAKLDAFPGNYPICSAASILGFVPTQKNQRLRIKVLPGRLTYLPSLNAPATLDPLLIQKFGSQKDIRSYTVTALTQPRTIPCEATAEFLVFASITDDHLVRCPSGCKGTSSLKKEDILRPHRAVDQVKNAEPMKGLLSIRDPRTPICAAAVDAGLLTPTIASDVLVRVVPAKYARQESDAEEPLINLAEYQLPFANMLDNVEDNELNQENEALVFGSIVEEQDLSRPISADTRAYTLSALLTSPKCGDVYDLHLRNETSADLTENYYCNGASSLRGHLDEVPSLVRVPELGVTVLFAEDHCVVYSGHMPDVPVGTGENSIRPRRFQVSISSGHYHQIVSLS